MINTLLILLVATGYSLDCTTDYKIENKKMREVQYINGVNTIRDKAKKTIRILQVELKTMIELNYNKDAIKQLIIAYNQINRNERRLFPNTNNFDKIIIEYRKKQLAKQDISNDSIIIGHSQGSLFGNEFCEEKIVQYKKFNIKGIYIGSPVTNHYCPGIIINNQDDPIPELTPNLVNGAANSVKAYLKDGVKSHDINETYLKSDKEFLGYIKESFQKAKFEIENFKRKSDTPKSLSEKVILNYEQQYSGIQLMYKTLDGLKNFFDEGLPPTNKETLLEFDDSTENYIRKIVLQMERLNISTRRYLVFKTLRDSSGRKSLERLLIKEENLVKHINKLDHAGRLEQYSCEVLGTHYNDTGFNKYQKIDAAERVISGGTFRKEIKTTKRQEADMKLFLSSPVIRRGL